MVSCIAHHSITYISIFDCYVIIVSICGLLMIIFNVFQDILAKATSSKSRGVVKSI